jgi:hypothetical protein
MGVASAAVIAAGISGLVIHGAFAADSNAPVETELGGGAPTKVLLDNNSLTVTLISYPAGFKREGGMRRRAEQLIVYVDDGDFNIIPRAGAAPNPNAAKSNKGAGGGERTIGPESSITLEGTLATGHPNHPKGTIAWHPKGSLTPSLETTRAYRALYIEFKR